MATACTRIRIGFYSVKAYPYLNILLLAMTVAEHANPMASRAYTLYAMDHDSNATGG
jgi:hypothetical protein